MAPVIERLQTLWGSTLQFLKEVRVELKKVTWPGRNEVIGSTAVVIVASFVVAFFWDSSIWCCRRRWERS